MNPFPLALRPVFCVETIFFMRRIERRTEFSFRELGQTPSPSPDSAHCLRPKAPHSAPGSGPKAPHSVPGPGSKAPRSVPDSGPYTSQTAPSQTIALLIPEGGPTLLDAPFGPVSLCPGQVFLCPFSGMEICRGKSAPGASLTLLLFSCDPPPSELESRLFQLAEEERTLLRKLTGELSLLLREKEGRTYPGPCRNAAGTDAIPDPDVRGQLGGTASARPHLIRLYLEELLLRLAREESAAAPCPETPPTLAPILQYLKSHLDMPLSLEQICRDNLIGRAQLTELFRSTCGCGVISFFSRLKIQAAQEMIRDDRLNFSQIADALGYTSVQYFSRRFRQIAGLTPSEYAAAVRKGGQTQKVPAPDPPWAGTCREL